MSAVLREAICLSTLECLLIVDCVIVYEMQLSSWFEELRAELHSNKVADSLEAAEQLMEQFTQQRDSTIDAAVSTISEGETLLEELRLVNALKFLGSFLFYLKDEGLENWLLISFSD